MPSGFTAGIIDGKHKTFTDFAKDCMRNFGATIHMRDDARDKEYEARVVSPYYNERFEEYVINLGKLLTATDKQLITKEKKKLKDRIVRATEKIIEITATKERLNAFLKEAKAYQSPTPEHDGIREFMINQIKETTKFDGSTEYYDKELATCKEELKNINVEEIRSKNKVYLKEDIERALENEKDEKDRCDNSNEWVRTFLDSLEEEKTESI